MWHPQLVFVLASDREVITPAHTSPPHCATSTQPTPQPVSRVGSRRVRPGDRGTHRRRFSRWLSKDSPQTVGSARHGPSSPMPTPPLPPKPSEGSVNGQLKLPVG